MKARADTLFYGGKIYTMEAPDICKDAVVLKDGKFAYVGTTLIASSTLPADNSAASSFAASRFS